MARAVPLDGGVTAFTTGEINRRDGLTDIVLGVDGKECDTGRVIAFEPPDRLTLAWHLNGNFQYDDDPAHASEVDVRFIAEDATHTRVELEHRKFERHGDTAAAVLGVVDSPNGWGYCLDLFAKQAAA